MVPSEVKPGTYRTRHASDGCYFARLKGFSGALEDIVANGNADGPVVVTILSTDKGFQSSNCDEWTADLSQITSSKTEFGEGDFIVGTDMVAGTYRSGASDGCYWARLKGFRHTLNDIAANGNTDAGAIVTIKSTDKGFESERCGSWKKV